MATFTAPRRARSIVARFSADSLGSACSIGGAGRSGGAGDVPVLPILLRAFGLAA